MAFQVVLFSVDWLRYRDGGLFDNPVHLRLFYTHLASLILLVAYGFAIRKTASVRQGRLVGAENWLIIIYAFLSLYGLPRAIFAYQDRQTLVLYVLYLLVVQVMLMIGHWGRLLLSIVSIGFIVPVVWVNQADTTRERYLVPFEVVWFTLGVFGLATYLYNGYVRAFIQNRLIETQHETLKKQTALLADEQRRAVQELEQRSQELLSYVLQEQQRNAFLLELRERVACTEPNRLIQAIDHQLNQEDRWRYFVMLFERLHPSFFSRMQVAYPTLNAHDLRLIALLKLNLSTKEISSLLGISPQSANTARYRLRKRLDLSAEASLESFLQQY